MWDVDAGDRARSRTLGSVGTSFALTSSVRFNAGRSEATWVLPAGTFTGLDSADRRTLSDWLDDASGIDNVIDLTTRAWNIAGAREIIGVFEIGQEHASWLIVRHRSVWTVARCKDGFVSDISTSLLGILGLIDEQRRA